MHTLFQKVKTLKKGVKINVRCNNIRNEDGNLLTKDADILRLCLYNAPIEADEDFLEQLWPNRKRDVRRTSLRAKSEQPSPRSNPGRLLVLRASRES